MFRQLVGLTQIVEAETEAKIWLSNSNSARSRQAVEPSWTGKEVNGLGRQVTLHDEMAKICTGRDTNRQTIGDACLAGAESGGRNHRPKMRLPSTGST